LPALTEDEPARIPAPSPPAPHGCRGFFAKYVVIFSSSAKQNPYLKRESRDRKGMKLYRKEDGFGWWPLADFGSWVWLSRRWVFFEQIRWSLCKGENSKNAIFSIFFGIKYYVFMSNVLSVFRRCVNISLEAAKVEFYNSSV
jgi:hypothetical protein